MIAGAASLVKYRYSVNVAAIREGDRLRGRTDASFSFVSGFASAGNPS